MRGFVPCECADASQLGSPPRPDCAACGGTGRRPPENAGRPKPLLVGEANPYGGDPEYALYPYPRGCAGHRLCEKVMGLTDREYLSRFDRVNLCPTKWSLREARERVADLRLSRGSTATFVLLGAKVFRAMMERGLPYEPFKVVRSPTPLGTHTFVVLPHPSGLSRAWNAPGSYERARTVLREARVLA